MKLYAVVIGTNDKRYFAYKNDDRCFILEVYESKKEAQVVCREIKEGLNRKDVNVITFTGGY